MSPFWALQSAHCVFAGAGWWLGGHRSHPVHPDTSSHPGVRGHSGRPRKQKSVSKVWGSWSCEGSWLDSGSLDSIWCLWTTRVSLSQVQITEVLLPARLPEETLIGLRQRVSELRGEPRCLRERPLHLQYHCHTVGGLDLINHRGSWALLFVFKKKWCYFCTSRPQRVNDSRRSKVKKRTMWINWTERSQKKKKPDAAGGNVALRKTDLTRQWPA